MDGSAPLWPRLLASALWASAAMGVEATCAARLAGLERLYFERIDGPPATHASVRRSIHAGDLASLLPEGLTARYRQESPAADSDDVFVQDFRVPRRGPELVLRQVLDRSHRITEQWWVLYADGRRTDAWFFGPSPERTEGKALTSVEITAVEETADGRVRLGTCGRMFRPQGAWWIRGTDLLFSASEVELRLDRVQRRFFASRGYDTGTG